MPGYFTVGHIPGSVQVQRFKDLGDNGASPLMRFPPKDAFQATPRRWGVNDDSILVLYDDSRTALASRLYFMLALNVVSLDGTDAQAQTWLGDDALAALYRDIPKDKTLYVYCHDGFRMSLAWMQLKHLGYEDVRLYNGGWSHWGNTLTLPVVEGEAPLSGDFAL